MSFGKGRGEFSYKGEGIRIRRGEGELPTKRVRKSGYKCFNITWKNECRIIYMCNI